MRGVCGLTHTHGDRVNPHGEQHRAPGAGKKPVVFAALEVLFSQKENSRNCVWVMGPCLYVNVCAEFSSYL